MYHIKDDKRSQNSARLIGDALIKCLQDTDFSRITITRIQQTAGVGRATFYRLFDNLADVLNYLCDEVYRSIMDQVQEKKITSVREVHLLFLEAWMQRDQLLEAVIDQEGCRLLTPELTENMEQVFSRQYPNLTEEERKYFTSISMDMIVLVLQTWIECGKKETAEQLLSIMIQSYKMILKHLTQE